MFVVSLKPTRQNGVASLLHDKMNESSTKFDSKGKANIVQN